MDDIPTPIPTGSSRFMDQLRTDMRARGYAYPTERTYLHWIKRYILFNKRRHPNEMGKPVKTHTFRHSFATRLLQQGYDIRTIQKLLGHSDVTTTEIYTHVLNRGAMGVISPLDS